MLHCLQLLIKKFMKKLILICLLLCLTLHDELDIFKKEMQEKVEAIANQMEDIFSRRCDYSVATCQVLSFNDCQGTSALTCHEDFPKPSNCIDGGAYLSEASGVRFPNSVNTDSLTTEEKQFVCTSALLEDTFKALDNGRNKRYGKAYIGTNSGAFRSYPSTSQVDEETGTCEDFDPRFRPWYVTATSGAKNVIIIIDTSVSMYGQKLTIAKDAATNVINTLSNSDFVGVVQFGSSAEQVYTKKITRATTEVKDAIIEDIDALDVSGQTNYEAAFTKGLALLKAAQEDEYGAPCNDGENIFLFLTDGAPTVGLTNSADLIQQIDSERGSREITVFTYALGEEITDTSILRDLACEYSGIMFDITDTSSDSSLATVMRSYYTYISEGVTIASPVWTEPYEDAFGFGKMVTVSMPVYYTEKGLRSILGVVGIDILWEQIEFGLTEQKVIERLVSNAPCHRSSLSECEIEQLRDSTCNNQVCTFNSIQLDTCSDSADQVFKDSQQKGSNICCGESIFDDADYNSVGAIGNAGIVGIVVGFIVVGVIVVIGIAIGCAIYKVKSKKRSDQKIKKGKQVSPTNRVLTKPQAKLSYQYPHFNLNHPGQVQNVNPYQDSDRHSDPGPDPDPSPDCGLD